MELSANEKIKNLLIELGMTQADFAKRTGISTAQVANLVNTTKNLSSEILNNIKKAFPEVNLNYLVMGSGSPILSAEEVENEMYRLYEERDVDKYIENLTNEIRELRRKLDEKRKLLSLLRIIDTDLHPEKAKSETNSETKSE